MANRSLKIVLLCGTGDSSRIIYHGITEQRKIAHVIIEQKPSTVQTLRRRVIRLGLMTVIGQVLFICFNKLRSHTTEKHLSKLRNALGLVNSAIPAPLLRHVTSVNCEETKILLEEMAPDVVIVNGTRIISNEILTSIPAPFINTHMGMTPKYRGVHGGYWALANEDNENCGVTVHLVDQGIDTGGILYQTAITVQPDDNYNSYPIHQIASAIPLMHQALNDIAENRLATKSGVQPSMLWSHPTLFAYLLNWWRKGVK